MSASAADYCTFEVDEDVESSIRIAGNSDSRSAARNTSKELEWFEKSFTYEASGFKTLLLVIDQVHDLLSVIGGISSFVSFCLASAAVVITSILYVVYKTIISPRSCSCEQRCAAVVIYLSIAVGSWAYIVGDNLFQSLEFFNWNETSMKAIENSSKLLLLAALTFLRIIPILIDKYKSGREEKHAEAEGSGVQPEGDRDPQSIDNEHSSNEHSSKEPQSARNLQSTTRHRQLTSSFLSPAGIPPPESLSLQRTDSMSQQRQTSLCQKCKMKCSKVCRFSNQTLLSNFGIVALGLFVDVDLVYTSVFQTAKVTNTMDQDGMCGRTNIGMVSFGIVFVSVVWALFIPVYFVSYKKAISKTEGCCRPITIPSVIQVIMVMLYSALYLLADHAHPLLCFSMAIGTGLRISLLATTLLITLSTTSLLSPIIKTIEEGKSCKTCICHMLSSLVSLIKDKVLPFDSLQQDTNTT